MKAALTTLGCKVNHYETEAMRELFLSGRLGDCCVFRTGRRLRREHLHGYADERHEVPPDDCPRAPDEPGRARRRRRLLRAGFAGDGRRTRWRRPRDWHERTKRDRIARPRSVTNANKMEAYIQPIAQQRDFEPFSAVRDSRTRATLKIQDGCVNFCSYCIIPYARGPLRSRPLDEISREVVLLANEGYREIVLTGIHLASYGRDRAEQKLTLLDAIRAASEPDWHPADSPWLAGTVVCDGTGRKGARGESEDLPSVSPFAPERVKPGAPAHESALHSGGIPPRAGAAAGIYAGLCHYDGRHRRILRRNRSEEHLETLVFCERAAFARMHVFPFSLRNGTKAETLGDHLPKSVKEARAKELIALGKRLTQALPAQSQIGSVVEVLVESGGAGYSGNYIRVSTNDAREGEIVRIRLTGFEGETAFGERLN